MYDWAWSEYCTVYTHKGDNKGGEERKGVSSRTISLSSWASHEYEYCTLYRTYITACTNDGLTSQPAKP